MSTRDFHQAVAQAHCWGWDADPQSYEIPDALQSDCLQQNPDELIEFCEWIEAHQIRRYLEIGVWTGKMASFLDNLFDFELLATCDLRVAEQLGHQIELPAKAHSFWGSSHSPEFMAWREQLGPIDLVLIDGDHTLEGVNLDFQINRRFPHRFLAFHDIVGGHTSTQGSRQLWQMLDGNKREIIHPSKLGYVHIPLMGIGIWSDASKAAP